MGAYGHDLRDYAAAALRAQIGVIFQDFVRYHLTPEKIWLGAGGGQGRSGPDPTGCGQGRRDGGDRYEVYKRLAELTADKTTIFISHRFSTVRVAQQILVLENGQWIEEGAHPKLMAQNGQYAKMFTTQAERYL